MVAIQRGARWWIAFCLGALTTVALVGIVVAMMFKYVNVPTFDPNKLQTPVGTDYFSVQYMTTYEALGAYTIPVEIGTNSTVTMATLLDTGSSDAWFTSGYSGYPSSSATFETVPGRTFNVNYLGGTVTGTIGSDQLGINGYVWSQSFGVVTSTSMALGQVKGLIGLSRGGTSDLTSPSYWALKTSVLSFYYDSDSWQGVFTSGFIDTKLYCAPGQSMVYTPQLGNYYWAGKIDLIVNGVTVGRDLTTVFDTGSTYMYLQPSIYSKAMGNLAGDACNNPVVGIKISGRVFNIPSSVLRQDSAGECKLRMDSFGRNGLSQDVLLGAVFLVNFYSVFDIANDRIGFCVAQKGIARRLQEREFVDKRKEECTDKCQGEYSLSNKDVLYSENDKPIDSVAVSRLLDIPERLINPRWKTDKTLSL